MFLKLSALKTAMKKSCRFNQMSTATCWFPFTHNFMIGVADLLILVPRVEPSPQFVEKFFMYVEDCRNHVENIVNSLSIHNRALRLFERMEVFLMAQTVWINNERQCQQSIMNSNIILSLALVTFTIVSKASTYDFSVLNSSTTTCVRKSWSTCNEIEMRRKQ